MRASVPPRARWLVGLAQLSLALSLTLFASCAASCPPHWLAELPDDEAYAYAAGSCGLLGLEIAPERVALTRAARALAERLGVDVSRQLSVTRVEGELVVEAYGDAGRSDALEGLELVSSARCGERVHVLVRLPR